jgi:LmbE family N-acetylglucosaminyl deacetylase
VTVIEGRGTAEREWRSWPHLWCLPELRLDARGRVVVVAPHPDDEILALGGLLRGHRDCTVLAVTDGEASHPDTTVLTPTELARLRRWEQAEALARLGRPDILLTRLGHADGAVDEDLLTRQLCEVLRPGDVCAATWRRDGHPDHEAVGHAAAAAAAASGATLWEYPVWTWHWARPADPRVPWARARALRLDPDAVAAKQCAIAAFRTQLEPLGSGPGDAAILPPPVRERFRRDQEIVFVELPG